ncbi:MAG TPA: metallophosphoesterase [Clostridia bacterium]|nr:metallophosphoesterase [Clostridia bacterium]
MLTVSRHAIRSARLPEAFSGFTIAHVSDLHDARFGEGRRGLIEAIRAEKPDLVAVTGDLVDRRRFDLVPALEFAESAVRVAPVYYVPGNHEVLCGQSELIRAHLLERGVHTLFDEAFEIARGGASIRIAGLRDPAFYPEGEAPSAMRAILSGWTARGGFTLLLSHRPELFPLYGECGVGLALCGHAHGGQIRLPFVGGLYAPHQGIFPKYASGLYRQGETTMLVSRGLGNSLFPLRVFNPPEIVMATLIQA